MANPLYGQNKADDILDSTVNGLTRGHDVIPVATDVTLVAADSGKTFFVDATGAGAEVDINLPAVSAGLNFRFICQEDTPTQDIKIIAGGAVVYGCIMIQSDTNEDNAVVAAGSTNVLFDTTCKKGDWLEYYCDGTSWYVRGIGTVQGAFTVS
jgi:hypothetical protein